jgi:hypothetical protein
MHSLYHRHRGARIRFFHGDDGRHHRLRNHLVLGGALVALGVAWLLRGWDMIGTEGLWLTVPAVLAWSGLVRIALDRSAASVVRVTVRLALAAYLVVVIEQIGALTWATTWPVLAIAAGVATVVDAVLARVRDGSGEHRDEEAAW